MERNAQARGIWWYTAHYTRLTAKFLAGHAQAHTSAHKRASTSGPKIHGDGILTVVADNYLGRCSLPAEGSNACRIRAAPC